MSSFRYQCMLAGLDATPAFWGTDEEVLAKMFNGCGPDKFSKLQQEIAEMFIDKGTDPNEALRKLLTEIFALFILGFVIHDFDFSNSDKTRKGFDEANNRLLENMRRLLNNKYPLWKFWLYPLRARWWVRMEVVYAAVGSDEGFRAWCD